MSDVLFDAELGPGVGKKYLHSLLFLLYRSCIACAICLPFGEIVGLFHTLGLLKNLNIFPYCTYMMYYDLNIGLKYGNDICILLFAVICGFFFF